MTIPDLDLLRIRRYVEARNGRIPASSRQFIRIDADVDDFEVTIVERRAPWDAELVGPDWTRRPVARIRYAADERAWTLYWPDGRSRFQLYDRVAPSVGVAGILDEIERDPLTVFWG